jgi:tetratricopeptide (TPR) repeat protein
MLADSLSALSGTSYLSGDYDGSVAASDEAQRAAEASGSVWAQAYSQMWVGSVYWERGDYGRAIEVSENCIRLGAEAGFVGARVIVPVRLALIYGSAGAIEQGLELLEGVEGFLNTGAIGFRWLAPRTRAVFLYQQGQLSEADALMEEVAAAGGGHGPLVDTSFDGELALARGEPERALSLAENMLSDPQDREVRWNHPHALLIRARALHRLGQGERAYAAAREARAAAAELGARLIGWEILAELSRLAEERGQLDEARDALREAQELIAYIADHTGGDALRNSFLGLPAVRAVLTARIGDGIDR